jgi:hypothetical protein
VNAKTLVLCALLLTAPVAWYRWDTVKNRGFEFGYYGVYNRFQHALEKIPGVTIANGYYNPDITLEEFGFDLTTASGHSVKLGISETDPIRGYYGAKLTAELTARIQQQAAAASPK